MRITGLLIVLLISLNSISQTDNFRILFGFNFGVSKMKNNQMVQPSYGYETLSWNESGKIHNTNYGTITNELTCLTLLGQVGVSVPFLKVKRISFGVAPKVGIGGMISNGNNIYTSGIGIPVKSLTTDASALLYMRCRLGELFHLSLLGGYRFVWSYYNYQSPVFGLEFGIDQARIGIYAHLSGLHYDRQLSNGETYPIEEYYDFGSVSLYYTLGKRWFDKSK